MNCKHVQELLPLYVGRDLEAKGAQIAAHIQSCADCAVSFAEYRETRQLLQEFAPPLFSEAVYDDIRQNVLREIGNNVPGSLRPTLTQSMLSLFQTRPRWAVASALLLALGVSALYFMAMRPGNLKNGGQQVAKSVGALEEPKPDPRPISQGAEASLSSPGKGNDHNNTGVPPATAGSVNHPYKAGRKNPRPTVDRPGSVAWNMSAPRPSNAETLPNGQSEPDAESILDPAARKTLRMEIQTRDPNIRIIWFSPPPTKQDSPGKFSKGI
jgi:hypothetical protein